MTTAYRDFSINPEGKNTELHTMPAVSTALCKKAKARRAIEDMQERKRLADDFGISTKDIDSISGGKDSTATALLAIERETENLKFVFADTGHESQITYDHISYLSEIFQGLCGVGIDKVSADFQGKINEKRQKLIGHYINLDGCETSSKQLKHYTAPILSRMIDSIRPTGNPFIDLCIWKGRFPSTRARFCSEQLKHLPLNEYIHRKSKGFKCSISWQGVRRDESAARRNLPEKDVEFGGWEPEPHGHLVYRPILDWSAGDTFEIAKKHNIKNNPLYTMGMGRVGCMPCIHATKAEVRTIEARLTHIVKEIEAMEAAVSNASKHGVSTLMDARITAKYLGTGKKSSDIDHTTHGFRTYCDYARTEHGGRQQSLIAAIELNSSPGCSSQYGLCE